VTQSLRPLAGKVALVTRAVLYLDSRPQHVAINEILVRPTDQER
jgi:NADP-dependent 3-hydroxy acid dehydrogenase YdfG